MRTVRRNPERGQPHPHLPFLPGSTDALECSVVPALRAAVRFDGGGGGRRASACVTAAGRGLYDFDFARSYGAYSFADGARHRDAEIPAGHAAGGVVRRASWRRWCASNAAQFAADVVVPVPLHRARQRERGYNQAELIAQVAGQAR